MSTLYRTTTPGVTAMLVTNTEPTQYYGVVKLYIDLVAGDVVSLVSAFEVTDDLGFNVMIGDYLKEFNPITSVDTILRRSLAQNVTPDVHHMNVHAGAFFTATETREHRFIHVGYAASSASSSSTDTVAVNYVDLQAKVD